MRIAYVTESFPPAVNGVAHTAVRVAEQLVALGHEVRVIAPEPARGARPPDNRFSFPVEWVRSFGLPIYRGLRIGLPGDRVHRAIADYDPDIVHLGGPAVLGASGCAAAVQQGLPIVSVYATDLPAYARAYHTGPVGEAVTWQWLRRIHNACNLTLAGSSATASDLRAHGIERVKVWARGVDCQRFDPAKRSEELHAELADGAELVVGYVGRLAAEKRLDLLTEVARLPGVRLVIVGGGPAEAAVRHALPSAVFLGQRTGEKLAMTYASFDVFVHAGPHDTFGQTLQEAAASGLPVVAPAAGGPLDLVRNGITGILVEPLSARALADGVAALRDPVLRAEMGAAGRETMLGRPWRARCEELVGLYTDVRGGGSEADRAAVTAGREHWQHPPIRLPVSPARSAPGSPAAASARWLPLHGTPRKQHGPASAAGPAPATRRSARKPAPESPSQTADRSGR